MPDLSAMRQRVLDTWAAAPARFREDANAEEELALGAYRDRLVVELAQNAADAAATAGITGSLLLRLDDTTLTAANTGAPLDAAGVEGLSTLRASAKRSADLGGAEMVGRFGVGFAAVLAVTDAPQILSHGGGVRWSRSDARQLVSSIPALAEEVERRQGHVPVLRLPFEAEPSVSPGVPAGYDTAVVLPLRDDAAVTATRRLLDAVDDALALVLPALGEIVIETPDGRRELRGGPTLTVDESTGVAEREIAGRRWRFARASGLAEPELFADRPVEERRHPVWSVTVAVPVAETDPPSPGDLSDRAVTRVIHAPTPTDDATDLPALIIGSFPLDSTRRRAAPGPLTDHLVDQAGYAYARLMASFTVPAVLDLVPGPLGASEVDAALHRAVHQALATTAFIPAAESTDDPHAPRLSPGAVQLIDGLPVGSDPAALAPFVSGLPARGWWRPGPLTALGARRIPLADLVDELATLQLSTAAWYRVYDALDGADVEALRGLPVPLADGRLVRGPRGALLPGEHGIADADAVAVLGLRVVAAEAAHPLLRRLGAVEASPATVLRDPAVRAAVEAADDDPETADPRLPAAVLTLVAASGVGADDEPWLARLPLPDATGTPVPAGELWLPDSAVMSLLDVDAAEFTVDPAVVEQHGPHTLALAGVRQGFAMEHEEDVPLDDELWHDLDDEDSWIEHVQADLPEDDLPPLLTSFRAIRDLELVHADSWARALTIMATDPELRAAVVEPAFVVTTNGVRHAVQSYTAWWLRRHALLDGRQLTELCTAHAEPVVRALLTPVDLGAELTADSAFLAALGIARTLTDVETGVLLDRLGHPAVTLTAAHVLDVYEALSSRPVTNDPAPARLRMPDGTGSRMVSAADVTVCPAPFWLQLPLPAPIPGPIRLAEVLDVDTADDVIDATVAGEGRRLPVPAEAFEIVPGAPETYIEHDDLVVGGHSVQWWVENGGQDGRDGGVVHAATFEGLARGLAWCGGRWDRRWLVAEALQDPQRLPDLLADNAFP